jgi:tetratricopeptide (TPR) repeat protein
MRRRLAVLVIVALASDALAAHPTGSAGAEGALAACNRSDALPERDRLAAVTAALAAAEAAVAADEHDAVAHFAVFCALGRQMRLRGLGIRDLLDVRRLGHAVDRAVELAPDWEAALVGKARYLLGLPWLLGGDSREAERLLRRALEQEPDDPDALLALAQALARHGPAADARAAAGEALAAAQRGRDDEVAADARELLRSLR